MLHSVNILVDAGASTNVAARAGSIRRTSLRATARSETSLCSSPRRSEFGNFTKPFSRSRRFSSNPLVHKRSDQQHCIRRFSRLDNPLQYLFMKGIACIKTRVGDKATKVIAPNPSNVSSCRSKVLLESIAWHFCISKCRYPSRWLPRIARTTLLPIDLVQMRRSNLAAKSMDFRSTNDTHQRAGAIRFDFKPTRPPALLHAIVRCGTQF